MKFLIDNETIHNWSQRYHKLPYYDELPHDARKAIRDAEIKHFNEGADCSDLARELAKRFPDVFELPEWLTRE